MKSNPVISGLLKAYKLTLSPVFYACGARCRHAPSCSDYAAEAVQRHGVWAGGWLGLSRVVRCRPGGSWGQDPVPDEKPVAPLIAPWQLGDWRSGERNTPIGPAPTRTMGVLSRAE